LKDDEEERRVAKTCGCNWRRVWRYVITYDVGIRPGEIRGKLEDSIEKACLRKGYSSIRTGCPLQFEREARL
jgi:hypothetical protein